MPVNEAAYARLKEVAHQETTVAYSELGLLVDLNMESPADRAEMKRLLDDISTHEHEQGRPLLSAVVTHKDGGPGKGFYKLARRLRLMSSGTSEIAFWSQELRRVYDCWSEATI